MTSIHHPKSKQFSPKNYTAPFKKDSPLAKGPVEGKQSPFIL